MKHDAKLPSRVAIHGFAISKTARRDFEKIPLEQVALGMRVSLKCNRFTTYFMGL